MSATKISRVSKGLYRVTKNAIAVACITKINATAPGNWYETDHWALQHVSGRIDRHDSLELARSDALKI